MSRGSQHLLLERVLVSAVLAVLPILGQKSTSRSLAPKRLARTAGNRSCARFLLSHCFAAERMIELHLVVRGIGVKGGERQGEK